MRKKFLATALVISLMASTVLTGCGGDKKSSKSNDSKDDTVTIQFMHQQVEQERQDVVSKIIEDFEKDNPNIKIEQMPIGEDDYDSKITALGGSGKLPAIIEFSQDQAKTSVTNQFIDTDACDSVIKEKGEDAFFDGALDVIKTEDGKDYVGVPVSGWVQGIWCNKAMLKEKGFDLPKNWDDVLKIAKAFYNPDKKQYGIALPTSDSTFTEQVFSQFALSNGANVCDANGKVTIDTDAMQEAADFYKELAGYSMPGSTEVADVKDAFVGKNTPMCVYSTYILGGCQEAGFLDDVELALPTNKTTAAYGCVTVLSISNNLDEAQTEATKKFVSYMVSKEGNEQWITMAPGGVQPVIKEVSEDSAYKENEAIVPFAHLLDEVGTAFDNLQLFGSVDGKNYMVMGDITNSGVISKALNNILVQKSDVKSELATAQKSAEALVK